MRGAIFSGANLAGVKWVIADLRNTSFAHANLAGAKLQNAALNEALLTHADLDNVSLVAANLSNANLQDTTFRGADFWEARLAGAVLSMVDLAGANLHGARLDDSTTLNEAYFDSNTVLCDVAWNGVSLSRIDWGKVPMTGDEARAREKVGRDGKLKDATARLIDCERAVRANRQLGVALHAQGLNEHADRFAYRAQLMERTGYRLQRRYVQWLFSWLLFLLAGYGYRLERIAISYVLIVGLFATGFLASDVLSGHGAWTVAHTLDALQISLNAIHGRVFFAQFNLDTVQSWLATTESIVGIVVEGVFVAMLIQRFFAR